MKKIENKQFIDWEANTFGFGYGTGEQYTIPALSMFFTLCKGENDSYDYEELENVLTPTVTWLMINILAHKDMIEYGTSPRYGWLTDKGKLLKEYLKDKSDDELYDLIQVDSDYVHCYPTHCNCQFKCTNPLF